MREGIKNGFLRLNRRWVWFSLTVLGLALLADRLFPVPASVSYSTVVTAADSTILHAFLSRDDKWRLYTETDEIQLALRDALLFKEDKYFFYHPGVNPVALGRSLVRNLLTGRRTSGASTITMQVARLLEPRERTYVSKLVELGRALQLECHYSKAEILRLYLNLLPYGSNIEGIKSASLLYFGKPPKLLSLAELVTLTIIPNRPSSLRPGRDNKRVVQERNRWLRRLAHERVFPQTAVATALVEPLTVRRRAAPQQLPHLARRLLRGNRQGPVLHTTIRPGVQAVAEQLVYNYANRMRAFNIQNAAVLVVDNQSLNVLAYVGSADFHNGLDGGQVDGVRAVRSPGSALKPLLYGLAFDAGLVTPKSKLNDVPTNFGGYEPENYDRHFNGSVTAEFALANSLNVPAVKLLRDLGTATLISALQKARFTAVRQQASDLGLSMILGGCGVTLEELTTLFAGFANGGRVMPLRYLAPAGVSASEKVGVALLSPESAFLITNTLAQITRPDLPNNFDNSYHLPRIAWKTGTSYGRRDAWSIGYNRRYTIGVWVGNFSGVGVPELSGANTATPLLFQLFNALDYNSPRGWFRPPTGGSRTRLALRAVCPESGEVPGDSCPAGAIDYYLMGVSASRRCTHQKTVLTDAAGRLSYCAHCAPEQGGVRRTYPNLAPELIAYYALQRIPYAAIPPHNPACDRVFGADADQKPLITSPNDGSEYFVDPRSPTEIQLSCQTANDVRVVYWYLNDQLFRKATPAQSVFIKPRPGRLKISCADDRGRHADIRVTVRSE